MCRLCFASIPREEDREKELFRWKKRERDIEREGERERSTGKPWQQLISLCRWDRDRKKGDKFCGRIRFCLRLDWVRQSRALFDNEWRQSNGCTKHFRCDGEREQEKWEKNAQTWVSGSKYTYRGSEQKARVDPLIQCAPAPLCVCVCACLLWVLILTNGVNFVCVMYCFSEYGIGVPVHFPGCNEHAQMSSTNR